MVRGDQAAHIEKIYDGKIFTVFAMNTGSPKDTLSMMRNDLRMNDHERVKIVAIIRDYADNRDVSAPRFHKTLTRETVGGKEVLLHEFRLNRWRVIWFHPPRGMGSGELILAQTFHKTTREFPLREQQMARRYIAAYMESRK